MVTALLVKDIMKHSQAIIKRISMIGALCNQDFMAPFMFQGHCNTQVFELYIENILIPKLTKGKRLSLIMPLSINQKKLKT